MANERIAQSQAVQSSKMDFSFRSEFYFHCWVREFEGETFLVLTARVKGTCIEMIRPPGRGIDSKAAVIKRFVLDLDRQATRSAQEGGRQ